MRLPSLLLASVLALAMPHRAAAQTSATTCALALSSPNATAGAPVTMTLTPTAGPWPLGVILTPVATGLQGTFNPLSAVGVGTTPVTFAFTASGPGNGTLSTANGFPLVALTAVAAPPTAPNTVTLGGATFVPSVGYNAGNNAGRVTTTGGGTSPVVLTMQPINGDGPAGNVTAMSGTGTWTMQMSVSIPSNGGYESGLALFSADNATNNKLRLRYVSGWGPTLGCPAQTAPTGTWATRPFPQARTAARWFCAP